MSVISSVKEKAKEFKDKSKQKKDYSEVKKFIIDQHNNHPLHGREFLDRATYNAFYNGHHYVQSRDNRLYQRGQVEKHRSKINLIKPFCHIAVSKLLKEQPKVNAKPTGKEDKDKKAARVAIQLLTHAFDSEGRDLYSKEYDVGINSYKHGTGWWMIKWNPDLYASTGKDSESDVGDYEVTVLDDFQIFPDPTQTEWEKLRWIEYKYMADIKELESIHKVDVNGVSLEGRITPHGTNEIESDRFAFASEHEAPGYQASKDQALVIEYWERPNRINKKGKHAIIINKEIMVKCGDNPQADLGYLYSMPFVPFFWGKTSERFHGHSPIADQIPIQQEINTIASLIMTNIRKTASSKFLVPTGSGISPDQITGGNDLIGFNPIHGGVPVVLSGASLSPYVSNWFQTLMGLMQDMVGLHEVSMGQIPERGSQIPASGIKLLLESELVRHAHDMRKLKTSLKHSSALILRLIKKYYTEKRYISIVGETGEYELQAFKNSDLDGSFDIILEVGSAINSSASTKIEALKGLWELGVFQAYHGEDPALRKAAAEFLKMYEFGTIEDVTGLERQQRAKAQWFLKKTIEDREAPDIMRVYDPKIFIDIITEYMLTKEFEETDAEIQEALDSAVEMLMENKGQMQSPPEQPQQGGGEMPMSEQEMNMSMGGQLGGVPQQGGPAPGGEMPPPQMPPQGAGQ